MCVCSLSSTWLPYQNPKPRFMHQPSVFYFWVSVTTMWFGTTINAWLIHIALGAFIYVFLLVSSLFCFFYWDVSDTYTYISSSCYNVMIQYFYILWKDHHNKLSQHPSQLSFLSVLPSFQTSLHSRKSTPPPRLQQTHREMEAIRYEDVPWCPLTTYLQVSSICANFLSLPPALEEEVSFPCDWG